MNMCKYLSQNEAEGGGKYTKGTSFNSELGKIK